MQKLCTRLVTSAESKFCQYFRKNYLSSAAAIRTFKHRSVQNRGYAFNLVRTSGATRIHLVYVVFDIKPVSLLCMFVSVFT